MTSRSECSGNYHKNQTKRALQTVLHFLKKGFLAALRQRRMATSANFVTACHEEAALLGPRSDVDLARIW